MKDAIGSMISDKDAKFSMDPANGTISVTATPADISKVAKYVNEQNARLSRQVAISVKVLQVTVTDSDQYGLDASAMFKSGSGSLTVASVPSLAGGTGIVNNLGLAIAPSNWNINANIQALSTQKTVSLVTSGSVTTLNNKAAPIQVVRSQTYISKTTKTNSGGDANYFDITVETGQIQTGFTMDVLPRIIEHGRLMLLFNLTVSDLVSLDKVPVNPADGTYIQNPIIDSRGFTQEVAMKSGETLILTGYEHVSNEADKSGLGSAKNSLLGGTATASKDRSIMVIILTPVVMESPLVPESRMKNNN